MGKIIVAMYLTLDGVMESPSWTAPYWEEELSEYQDQAQREADALLLGRVTYQQFAAAWPQSRDEGAAYMNGIRKHVPTGTLKSLSWNAARVKQPVMDEIRKLRENNRLLVYGSGRLVRSLLDEGLVDEYREMVFPVILGTGKKLFTEGMKPCTLHLAGSRRTPKGVLLNTYTKLKA